MTAFPGAVDMPGPANKVWPDVNGDVGVICHSSAGTVAADLAELADVNNPRSWHYTVAQDGTVYEHYPLTASCWHAGSHQWNARLIGIEHEGGAEPNVSEPLTPAQLASSTRLVAWIAQQLGWQPSRQPATRTLYEHNEVYPTACPSGRIPWEAYMPPADPITPSISLEQSTELQYVLGAGTLAITQPEGPTPQDYTLYVAGQVPIKIPAGTACKVYTVYVPLTRPPGTIGS